MNDDASARLALPYLAAGQLQKHVTLNEALTRLDALVQTAVLSRTLSAQPVDPDDGDLYILPAEATGAEWATRAEGDLLRAETGAWSLVAAPEGLIATALDTGQIVVRRDGGWSSIGEGLEAVQNLTRLGLATTADAVNPFSAKLNKALWTARETGEGGDGDLRMTFNKQANADVLSLLFQSAYGGRAELGLIGDDDLRLKVSADGAVWHDALAVDRATGRVAFARGATRSETVTFITDADYAVPAWAQRLAIVAVGGGAGGGSGSAGASSTARYGGGGGGAGGVAHASWAISDIPATLQIDVGQGGQGGLGVAAGQGNPGVGGGSSTVSGSGIVLLTGAGGRAGLGGTTTSGLGGDGGQGTIAGNAGGDSSIVTRSEAGASAICADGSGGGGAGGGLSSANAARSGGAGGEGAVIGPVSAGGTGGTGAIGGMGAPTALPAIHWAGGGGGGGGAVASGSGHAGGDGAVGGAGGGGSGAGSTGSGSGGSGGRGLVRITAIG